MFKTLLWCMLITSRVHAELLEDEEIRENELVTQGRFVFSDFK